MPFDLKVLRDLSVNVDPAVLCMSSDVATVVGYLVVSRPFLDLAHPRHLNSSHSELLEVSLRAFVETECPCFRVFLCCC